MLGHCLAYVALVVTDVEATASVFERIFGLRKIGCSLGNSGRSVPVFMVGKSALALFAPDDPFVGGAAKPGVHHIALGVENVAVAADLVASRNMALRAREPVLGLNGTKRLELAVGSTAGVKTYLSEPLQLGPPPASWVERIDHIGIASADNNAAIDIFTNQLGYPLESTQTDTEVQIPVESFTSDKYGVVYHTRAPEPVGGLRVAFITTGDCELEFLQDLSPQFNANVTPHQPGTTKQDRGAIARYVATRGPGLHHLALKVTNINRALSELARAGLSLIDTVGRPGSRRAQIGFIHPKSLYGVLLHLVERQPL
jgi:catechol 2,3-dioxygenase-like lactoylglutathione lyase family enzyme